MTLDFRYVFIRIWQYLVYFSNYLQDNFFSNNNISLKWDEELLIIKLDRIWDAVWTVQFCKQLKNSYRNIKISVLCNSYNKFVFSEYRFLFSKIVEIDSNPRNYSFPNVFKLFWNLFESIIVYIKSIKKLTKLKNKINYTINLSWRKWFVTSLLIGNSVWWWLWLFNFLYKYPLLCHDEIWSNTHIIQKWLNKFNLKFIPDNSYKNIYKKNILIFIWWKFPSKLKDSDYLQIKDTFVSLWYKVEFLTDNNSDIWYCLKKNKRWFEVNWTYLKDFLRKYAYFVSADWWVLHYASLYIKTISFYSSTNFQVASPSVLNIIPIRKVNEWSIYSSICSNHIVVTKSIKCQWCFQFWCILKKCWKFIDNESQMIIKLVVELFNP